MLYITFRYVEHDIQKGQAIILCDNDRVYRDDEVVEYNEKAGVCKPYSKAYLYNKHYFDQLQIPW